MSFSAFWQLLKETYAQWSTAKPFQLAAALAYYTLFSLAPLLLIAIAIAGLVFGRDATEHQILTTFQGLMGPQGARAIEGLLHSASTPASGIVATVIGIVTLLIGAGGVVGQLQEALNTIWEVEAKPESGVWGLLRTRFVSFAMVLGVGFLLLVSLLVSAVLAAMIQVTQDVLPGGEVLWQGIEFLVSVGLITLLFALIYKVLPDVDIAWRDVWIGAGMTAVLFTLGKFLLGLYLGREGVTSPYGAAGSLVLVLLWVYYSGLIFLFGAAFTKVHAASHDAAARPTAKAVFKESPWEPARQHGTETGHAPPSRHNQVRYRNGKMSDPSPPLPK
jgi:membrane protein